MSFQTDYIGKGVEESYFTRQGSMVSVGIPRFFRNVLFVKQQMVLINTEKASRLEGNIENLPSVLTGGHTIDSEDVVEIHRIAT